MSCGRRNCCRIVRCATGERVMDRPDNISSPTFDLAKIRQRLAEAEGPTYWRSLEELSGTPEFVEAVEREFPALKERLGDGISRRAMLKVMGASLAMLGLSGCFY